MEPNKDKEKDNKPIIPTLRDSAGKPQLKIKGVAQGGMSLIERLKQFKKKDLAFIMAGLGVLFMAPLAEHFMMSPEGQNGDLFGPGISSRGDGKAFGGSSSPYETGGTSMAPGNALGQNGDVITPLNVRDPSSLIMGPGSAQQPPAGSASTSGPTIPPDKKESGDWKDALKESAARAGGAATKAAGLPVPKPTLGASALHLGSSGGGGNGGGFTALSAPSAANVPNKAASSNALQGVGGGRGIKGVARGPGDGSGGAFDELKKKAGLQGSDFNRNGQAAGSSLDQAASRSMSADGTEGGASGESKGGEDKGTGANSGKDGKSVGESLEFLREKAEQDHAIDLEWKLKEKAAMRWPNLEDKVLEEAVMTPFKAITGSIADTIKKFGKGDSGTIACDLPVPGGTTTQPISIDKSTIVSNQAACSNSGSGDSAVSGGSFYWYPNDDIKTGIVRCGDTSMTMLTCETGKGGPTNPTPKEGGDNSSQLPPGSAAAAAGSLNAMCQQLNGLAQATNPAMTIKGGSVKVTDQGAVSTGKSLSDAVKGLYSATWAMTGSGGSPPQCNGTPATITVGYPASNVQNLLTASQKNLNDVLTLLGNANKAQMTALSPLSPSFLKSQNDTTNGDLASFAGALGTPPAGDPVALRAKAVSDLGAYDAPIKQSGDYLSGDGKAAMAPIDNPDAAAGSAGSVPNKELTDTATWLDQVNKALGGKGSSPSATAPQDVTGALAGAHAALGQASNSISSVKDPTIQATLTQYSSQINTQLTAADGQKAKYDAALAAQQGVLKTVNTPSTGLMTTVKQDNDDTRAAVNGNGSKDSKNDAVTFNTTVTQALAQGKYQATGAGAPTLPTQEAGVWPVTAQADEALANAEFKGKSGTTQTAVDKIYKTSQGDSAASDAAIKGGRSKTIQDQVTALNNAPAGDSSGNDPTMTPNKATTGAIANTVTTFGKN